LSGVCRDPYGNRTESGAAESPVRSPDSGARSAAQVPRPEPPVQQPYWLPSTPAAAMVPRTLAAVVAGFCRLCPRTRSPALGRAPCRCEVRVPAAVRYGVCSRPVLLRRTDTLELAGFGRRVQDHYLTVRIDRELERAPSEPFGAVSIDRHEPPLADPLQDLALFEPDIRLKWSYPITDPDRPAGQAGVVDRPLHLPRAACIRCLPAPRSQRVDETTIAHSRR